MLKSRGNHLLALLAYRLLLHIFSSWLCFICFRFVYNVFILYFVWYDIEIKDRLIIGYLRGWEIKNAFHITFIPNSKKKITINILFRLYIIQKFCFVCLFVCLFCLLVCLFSVAVVCLFVCSFVWHRDFKNMKQFFHTYEDTNLCNQLRQITEVTSWPLESVLFVGSSIVTFSKVVWTCLCPTYGHRCKI